MLRDITIGQNFPGKSVIHRMDPRMKLILSLVYIVMLFCVGTEIGFLVPIVFLIVAIQISKIPMKMVLKGIKPILPLIIFTAVLNIFFVSGTPLVQWGFLTISLEGILVALKMVIRIIFLIMGTSLLTYTTSPIALTDAIEQLLKPLNKIKFPVHEMAMMMTIALRFIPTLIEETDKIMSAQKARGADMESGGLRQRIKAMIPILIPLFVSAFRRAEELALAMECRCYRGGEGRTRMRQLHYSRLDWYGAACMALCFAVVIVLNLFAPTLL
ncbi:MAG: energy-coupling factor transporter transmembrane protein EcfT [Clostridiales bacterium]|nr:energy-coupling factor transporter transmembrane protein EcfT [Clostridiales bacterium]